MSRSIAAVLAATSLVAIASLATTATAQEEPPPPPSEAPFAASGTIELELLEQSFDLAPNGNVELTYRLTGDLATVAELTPPTTTTTTTTPTTVPPTTTPPTTVPAADPAAPDATVQVTPDAPATTPPTTEPTPTTTLPTPVPLTLAVVNYQPINDPADLAGRLGPNPRASRFPFANVLDGVGFPDARTMIQVERADVAILRISVPTDVEPSQPDRLRFLTDGIHPILVQLSVDEQVVAQHATVVERRSNTTAAPPPIDLALIATIDDPGPTADDEAFATAAGELEDLLSLAAVVEAPIALDIPPSVAAAAVDADDIRNDAADILSGEEVLAAPATPFDVSSATAVGRIEAFVRQLRAGEDDMRELLGVIAVRDVWLASEPLSAEGAQVLRDLGVRYLAMPADVYLATVANTAAEDDTGSDPLELPTRDRFIELDLPDGSTMSILLIDDELGANFEAERTDEILAEQTPTEWALETVAQWRLAQYATPRLQRREQLSRLIAAPGFGTFDPTLVLALESFAEGTQAIRFTNASVLASVTDTQGHPDGAALPDTAGPSLEARLDNIALVQADLDDTASMLPDDDDRPAQWSRRLDSFVSTAFGDEAVDAQLGELVDEAARIRGGVVAPDPFTFTLTGREEQRIDIRIENTLDEPLRVLLRLSSPRLSFPNGDMPVTLAAADTTVVDVAVIARSNGTSAVTVEVLTPLAQRPLIEPVRLTSRVNALTGLGQVLTAAFVLILASWWISSWRSKRRARDADDAEHAHPASGTDHAPAE